MIETVQQKSLLIGSEDSVKALAKKESASVLLVSDSHGRHDIFRAIIERFGSECDALAFCGDGIGDFCSMLMSRNKTFLKKIPPVAAFVRGNGDCSEFPAELNPEQSYVIVPRHQTLKAAGMNILLTHGHTEGAYYGLGRLNQAAAECQADIVFYGHTHIASRREADLTYFINPGSCSHPRGGQKPSFAVVRVPGGTERAETAFFSIKVSIAEGFEFTPYTPEIYY